MRKSSKAPSYPSVGKMAGVAALLLVVGTGTAWAAAETFNTALPVAAGNFIYRQQFVVARKSGDLTPANRDIRVFGGVSILGYGVTPDFTLFGIFPYLYKRVDFTTGGLWRRRSTQGIGDMTVLGRYTVYADNGPGRTFRVSPFAGLKIPTGEDGTFDRFGRLPRDLQRGSGSWDPMAGIVATWQTLDYEIDAQAQYKANTTADGFRFGDEARLDASFQYRLWPRTLTNEIPGFFYGVIETNLVHQDKNSVGGVAYPNSGGTTLFLDPGIQYVTERWVLEAIVQLPAIQNLNGTAVRNDYNLSFGFRVNF